MRKYTILLLLLVGLTACGEWFGITPDSKSVPENRFFKNENAFLNALTDVYTQLRSESLYGKTLSVGDLEFMAQNFVPSDAVSHGLADLVYAPDQFDQTYQDMYKAIASCNNVIKNINATNIVFNNANQKEIITGELYALRGALHFDLLRLFHPSVAVSRSFVGIPYMTEFGNDVSAAQSTDQLLGKIIQDLNYAAQLLKSTDPVQSGFSSATVPPGRIDSKLRTFAMNYYAVLAVLARVSLYNQDYVGAVGYADEIFKHLANNAVRNKCFYFFAPGKYGADFSFSREHVFAIASPPTGLTELSEKMFEEQAISVTKHYGEFFQIAKDTRHRDWFIHEGGSTVMSKKFGKDSKLAGYTAVEGTEHLLPVRIPFIKLGEVSLVAAEALLNNPDKLTEAAQWLVDLQAFRDVTTVENMVQEGTLTVEKLRAEIDKEYHRELFGEGQLFYYYKRLNLQQIPSYDGAVKQVAPEKYTLPIPASALNIKS